MALSKKLASSSMLSEGGLAERRLRREARFRPWLTASASGSTKKAASSTTAPASGSTTARPAVAVTEKRVVGVVSVTPPPPSLVQVTKAAKAFAGYNRDAAFACGSRLPRLAAKPCTSVSARVGEIGRREEKASGVTGEVKSRPSPYVPSKEQACEKRTVAAPAVKPHG
ncbi:hypothetical protein LTS08_004410 [Lithohypha guttulata]|nr:hypothetical protein LTS08_004410 [Lithohypha guttulata]